MRYEPNSSLPDELCVSRDQIGFADWKDSPAAVLDHVDEILKPYGLEIVMIPQDDDMYYWKIGKRS